MKLLQITEIKYFDKTVCNEHFIWYIPGEPYYESWDNLSEHNKTEFIKSDIAFKLNIKATSWITKTLNPIEIEQIISEKLSQEEN